MKEQTTRHHQNPVTTAKQDFHFVGVAGQVVDAMDMREDEVQWGAQRRKVAQDLLSIREGLEEGPKEIHKIICSSRPLTPEEELLVGDLETMFDERERIAKILGATEDLKRRAEGSPLATHRSAELASQLRPFIDVLTQVVHNIEVKLGVEHEQGAVGE